jgi:hypothetical protein
MKPVLENNPREGKRPFPLTHFNYQAVDLDGCNARCVHFPNSSFHNIYREYFRNESPRVFGAEALIYGAFALTVLPALFDTARAIVHLLGTIV